MIKKYINRICAFTTTLLVLANITPGYLTPYHDKKKKHSKQSFRKDDFFIDDYLKHFLQKHFKGGKVWKVLPKQNTDIKYFIELKRDGWQHFMTKRNGADCVHILKECFAYKMPGTKIDLNPAAKFTGGVYATVKGPGQSDRYLHGKYTDNPTAQEAMSKYKYINKNKKEVGIKYQILQDTLIISDDKNKEIGRLELEPVSFKKPNTLGTSYGEKLDEMVDGKTMAQVNYVVEKIQGIKNKDQRLKKNPRLMTKIIKDALLDPNFSDSSFESTIKLSKKTKEEFDRLIQNIRSYRDKGKGWDDQLDQIIKFIEKSVI